MNEHAGQLDDIRDRLSREPYNAELHQLHGKALFELGRLEEAKSAFQTAAVYDPSDSWNHLFLGTCFYEQAQYAEALAAFRGAHEADPRNEAACVCMADTLAGLGRAEDADRFYRLAVEITPDSEIAQRNLRRWQNRRKP